MGNKQIIGIIGVVLLVIGVFSPIVHMPLGSITYFHNGKGDGIFVLFFAILASYYLYKERYISVRFTGFASLGVLLFTFIKFQMKITDMQSKLNKDMAGNPFKGIADLAMQNLYLEWGFALILVGSGMLILSSFIKDTQNKLDNSHFVSGQREDTFNNSTKSSHTHTSQLKTEKKTTHVSQKQQEFKNVQPVNNDKQEEVDDILTRIQSSTQKTQELNQDGLHVKHPKTRNKYILKGDTGESFLKKYGLRLAVVLIIGFNVYLYFSEESDDAITGVKYEQVKTEVSNSYKDQMGWGKADKKAEIESVKLRVGKMVNAYSDTFTYPTPVIELSVKNIGDEKLRSFGINFEVKDIDNKRRIGGIAVASGSIDPGWTSQRHILSLPDSDFSKLIGNKPINFKMSLDVFVSLPGGEDVKLYEGVIDPIELKTLPIISY